MARLPYNSGPAYPLNILKLLGHSSGTYEKWTTLAGAHFTVSNTNSSTLGSPLSAFTKHISRPRT